MKYALIVWILPFGLLNCLNYADWRLWSLVSVWSCKVFGHACYKLKAYTFLNFTTTMWIQYYGFFYEQYVNIWVVSSWSLSIYLVFQLVCKSNLAGTVDCWFDGEFSCWRRRSETAPTWLLSLCLPSNCFAPPLMDFTLDSKKGTWNIP